MLFGGFQAVAVLASKQRSPMGRCIYLSDTQINLARNVHIARLMANASIQGQGDEYRRPGALPTSASSIARSA